MHDPIRKIIGSTLIITSSLFCLTTSYAAPIQDKTIEKLMKISDIKGVISQTNRDLKPMFDEQAQAIIMDTLAIDTLNTKELEAADKISNLMAKLTSDITEDPKFYDMIKNNYKKIFTEEEALANIAFLETPIGQSITKKSTLLMTDIMNQSQQIAEQTLKDPKKKEQFMEDFTKILEPLIEERSK